MTSPVSLDNKSSFAVDPVGAKSFGYYPVPVKFSAEKPAGITKEPAYRTKPMYGTIVLGNGPNSKFIVAVDEPADADFKIYVDKNHNGDLTDDGDGAWPKKTVQATRTMYGVLIVPLRASYGTAKKETSSADYSLGLYRFTGMDQMFTYRQTARVGTVNVEGANHKAVVVDNDSNAIYDTRVTSAEEAAKSRPIWMKIDLADDGKYSSGIIDVRAPFKLGNNTYEALVSTDGSKIDFHTTTKPALDLAPKRAPAPELLKTGAMAPEFTAEKWGGGNLNLADYKGKVVVLDFWATWCGPCMASMPHIETVNKAVAGQDVVVLGVCVWDDKAAYEAWIPKNKDKFSFQFAFDPAGRNTAASIAAKQFKVSGIPTTYIIDRDGKVAEAIVGFEEGDKRVEVALKKLGVKL